MHDNTVAHINADISGVDLLAQVEKYKVKIIPYAVAVKVDCNPIARYNYAIWIYHHKCNQIQGIKLTSIWCPCAISWLYDCLIYFYTAFFLAITCRSQVENACLYSLLMLFLYICILFIPIISTVTLGISGIFFLYYIAGLIVKCYNNKKLGTHEYTERMVPETLSPPFTKFYNQFFRITAEQTSAYYLSHNMAQVYQKLKREYVIGSFMAYKPQFLSRNYYYITSCKMIAFHFTFILLSVFGAVVSILSFPTLYGM